MVAATGPLSDEKAARMMIALREGRTLRTFGVTPVRLEAYFTAHPDYALEARPLIDTNANAARLRKGAYLREKSHCINGHSFADFGRVAMHKGWMTRQCRACERMRYHRGGIIKPAVLEMVTARIAAGTAPRRLSDPGAGYLVRFDTLARYRRENPEFDRLVIEARESRLGRAPVVASGTFRYVWDPADAHAIPAMLSDHFPGKQDVVQSIFLELIEGSLDRKQLGRYIKGFVADYNRQHPGKFAKFGGGRLISLEQPLFDDGSGTIGDTVSRGLWD